MCELSDCANARQRERDCAARSLPSTKVLACHWEAGANSILPTLKDPMCNIYVSLGKYIFSVSRAYVYTLCKCVYVLCECVYVCVFVQDGVSHWESSLIALYRAHCSRVP